MTIVLQSLARPLTAFVLMFVVGCEDRPTFSARKFGIVALNSTELDAVRLLGSPLFVVSVERYRYLLWEDQAEVYVMCFSQDKLLNRLGPCGMATPDDLKEAIMERAKFEGIWSAVSIQKNGKMFPISDVNKLQYEFIEDTLLIRDDIKNRRAFITPYKVDPKKKEMTYTDEKLGKCAAIYRIDGDKLAVCAKFGEAVLLTPPTEFSASKGDDNILITFERRR